MFKMVTVTSLSLPNFFTTGGQLQAEEVLVSGCAGAVFFWKCQAPFPPMLQRLFEALTLTFLAEWGDRSQISTIALAAAKDMDRKRLWEKHHDLNNWV